VTLDTILGRAFAGASSEQQAEMLNAAGRSLYGYCGCDEWRLDMQANCIADTLDEYGKRLIKRLHAFIEARETKP
jgi:hypothetical protein